MGRVGRRVAQIATALGMRVVAHDPYVPPTSIRDAGAEPTDLPALLATADFVSLHARATADNRHMIGARELATMKEGSFLINTARDTLVDEDALYDALRSGHLAGAAMDLIQAPRVDAPLTPGRRHRLLDAPNVIITPHIGGATVETLSHGGEMLAAEIERFARGEPLVNVANPAVLERVASSA
jgi:D-3-phosphoglycerate dehydrogenase